MRSVFEVDSSHDLALCHEIYILLSAFVSAVSILSFRPLTGFLCCAS